MASAACPAPSPPLSLSTECSTSTYYNSVAPISSGAVAFKASLHSLISPHNVISYTPGCWHALRVLDGSASNPCTCSGATSSGQVDMNWMHGHQT